jgi:hypothetical protein
MHWRNGARVSELEHTTQFLQHLSSMLGLSSTAVQLSSNSAAQPNTVEQENLQLIRKLWPLVSMDTPMVPGPQ